MVKKYKFPVNLFVVFEKINPVIYTSNKIQKNHYICLLDAGWYSSINLFFKNELFYSLSMISDISAIDVSKYDNFILKNYNNNKFIYYGVYYFYFLKIRLSVLLNLNLKVNSIDFIFKNANWMERETFEMYGINMINKKDNRFLLLDYSKNYHPFLKIFPSEGYFDIYYNFFENKLSYINNEYIEL